MVNENDPDVETVVEALRDGFGPRRTIGELEDRRVKTNAATDYVQEDPDPFLDIVEEIVAVAYRAAHREPARVEETTGKEQLSVDIQDNLAELLLRISNESPDALVDHRRRLVETGIRANNRSQKWNYQQVFTNLAAHDHQIAVEVFDSLLSTFTDAEAGDRRPVAGYYVRCIAGDHEDIAERGLPQIRDLLRDSPVAVRTEAVEFVGNLVDVGLSNAEAPSETALDATADVRPLLDADDTQLRESAVETLFEISEYAPKRLCDDVERLAEFIGHEGVSFSAATTIERVIEAEPGTVTDLPESIVSPFPDGDPTAQEHSLRVLSTVVDTGLEGNEASSLVHRVLPDVVGGLESDSKDVASEASELLSAVAEADPDSLVPEVDNIVVGLTSDGPRFYTRRTLERLVAYDPATLDTVLLECRRLLEAESTTHSTKEAVTDLLSEAAEDYPRRLTDFTEILAGVLDQDDDVSYNACLALKDISNNHPETIVEHAPALLDVVDDENARGRWGAAVALTNVAEVNPDAVADGVDKLLTMMFTASDDTDSSKARSACITVIDERPSVAEDLLPEVRSALDSNDIERRIRAVRFTSSAVFFGAEPFYELRPSIEDALEANDDRLTESAAECIGRFADVDPESVVDAVPTLGETLHYENEDIRKEVADAIWHVATDHPKPIADIFDDLVVAFRGSSDYTKDSICRVLNQVAEETDSVLDDLFVELVEFGLEYTGSTTTSNAIDAIGSLSASVDELPRGVRSELERTLREGSTARRENAAAIARVLTGQSSGSTILGADVTHKSPPDGTAELLPVLTDAFESTNEDVRKHAVWAVCGLSRTDPAAVIQMVEELDSLLGLESEERGQAMFPAAEALYHLAGHDAEVLVSDELDLVGHLIWLAIGLDKQSFAESPASDLLGYTIYTTHGAKALGRVAQTAPDVVAEEFVEGDSEESLADFYVDAYEDVQGNLLGLLKEISHSVPEILGEDNEELTELFNRVPEAREDVAEVYCVLAEADPDQVVESVPELITALEARPGTQTEKNLIKAIATIADSEPVDLRAHRDTFVDLFADGSLDIKEEVMLVDLLTQIPSTVDIGLRPQ